MQQPRVQEQPHNTAKTVRDAESRSASWNSNSPSQQLAENYRHSKLDRRAHQQVRIELLSRHAVWRLHCVSVCAHLRVLAAAAPRFRNNETERPCLYYNCSCSAPWWPPHSLEQAGRLELKGCLEAAAVLLHLETCSREGANASTCVGAIRVQGP